MARPGKRRTIAEVAEETMRREGLEIVMWGDGVLVNIAVDAGVTVPHPLNKMDRVIAALRRSPRFEHMRIRGYDSRGRNRVVSGFRLLG